MTRPLQQLTRVLDVAEQAMRAERPHVTFRQVDGAARQSPPCPDFLFGPINETLAQQMYGQTMLRASGCYVLRNAAVGPNGIALHGAVAFCADGLNHHRPYVHEMLQWLNGRKLPVREVPGPLAALFGPSHEVFGHFIVDYLPRLWLLAACGYDLASLRFVVPAHAPPWSLDLLTGCGLRPDQFERFAARDEVLRTDTLILPTTLRSYERLCASFAPATRFWVERLRARQGHTNPPATRRLFVSRRGASNGRVVTNRDAVEAIAEAEGFVIVHPGKLTLPEQVALFGGAAQIAGEYGSGLHNAVFAGPGTLTCALRGTLRDPGFIQSSLVQALEQRVGYVFGATTGSDRDQRVTIDEGDFRRAIRVAEI